MVIRLPDQSDVEALRDEVEAMSPGPEREQAQKRLDALAKWVDELDAVDFEDDGYTED